MHLLDEIRVLGFELPVWVFGLSLAIFVASMVFVSRIYWKSRALVKRMGVFSALIRKHARQESSSSAMSRLEVEGLRQDLLKDDSLRHWWQLLERHTQAYKGRGPVEAVYLVAPSRESLPEDDLIGGEFNSDFYHSLPGLVTGVGLAITFTAILLGLSYVSYDPTQISNPVQGIEGLINNLSGKFASSVVALVSAIILTVVVRRRERSLDRAYRSCVMAVSEAFPRLTEAMILADIQASGSEREKALKNITSDMVDGFRTVFLQEVNPAFSEGILKTLGPNLGALNETLLNLLASIEKMEHARQESILADLRTALDSMHHSLVESFGTLGQDFQKSMGQVAHAEFERVQEALAGSARLLENINHSFSETQTVFTESLREFYAQARAQMEQWLEPLGQSTQALADTGTQLRDTSDHLKPVLEGAGQAMEHMRTAISTALEVADRLVHSGEQVRTHLDANAQTMIAMAQVQQRAGASLTRVEEIQQEGAKLLQGYQSTMTLASQSLGSLDQDLEKAFASIHEGLKAWTQSADGALRQFTSRSNEHLSSIARSLGAQIESLGEKLEELSETLDRLPAAGK